MEKMPRLIIQKRSTLFVLCLILFLLSLSTVESASAHGERLHLPFDLPACTARMMVCEVPSTTFAPLSEAAALDPVVTSTQLGERHCLDGAGVPKSCFDIGPFEYMPQNLAVVKGSSSVAKELNAIGETACVNGEAVANESTFPCSNVDLLAFMPLADIGGGFGNDIWGWTDPVGGGEYVVMGRRNGTSFVDISDPINPVYLGDLPTEDGITSSWRDVKVYNNHAFIVVDDSQSRARTHGMQIFDLTQLPAAAATTATLPRAFTATTVYTEIYGAHNVAINEASGFAYIVGSRHAADDSMKCRGGLHMVDVTTPSAPTFAGCVAEDGYTHDTQCVIYDGPDAAYQGSEICFNSNEDSLTIVDVTAKDNPVQIAKAYYLNFCEDGQDENCNSNNGAFPSFYTHQGWLTEDHAYFVQDDELDELGFGSNTVTYMWNLEDLDNPQYIGNYTSDIESIDHNLYIRDQYIYQANYVSGLRILDATNIAAASLSEVAYFDTYPDSDGISYDGAWSSYPFFESGVVPVSTIGEGLFLLRPTLSPAPVLDIFTYMPIVHN